jgi:hypothetical protein
VNGELAQVLLALGGIVSLIGATVPILREYRAAHEAHEDRDERELDRLQRDIPALLLRAQEAEQRAFDAVRRADQAEAARVQEAARRADAEQAVQNGVTLLTRLDTQQREMAALKRQLQVALARIADLEKQVQGGA